MKRNRINIIFRSYILLRKESIAFRTTDLTMCASDITKSKIIRIGLESSNTRGIGMDPN